MTSCPPEVRASLTTLRMNAASSTTNTRAISSELLVWGGSVRECRGGGLPALHLRQADRPVAVVVDHQRPLSEPQSVYEQVDRRVGVRVQLDDGAERQGQRVGEREPRAAEFGPYTHRDAAERLLDVARTAVIG